VAPDSSYTLAAVLATGDIQRLYSGLSLLVSAAVDGEACAALATFRSLELIVDPGLGRLAADPEATPGLAWQGREKFARSLAELRDTALSLDSLAVFGCSASIDTMPLSASDVEDRLDGVMSTPRFLRETAGARLLFV
jgi:peroxiredoxin family protein